MDNFYISEAEKNFPLAFEMPVYYQQKFLLQHICLLKYLYRPHIIYCIHIDNHCEKNAFSSPLGLFQFTVMPFGLSGAPASFQRMMDQALRGLNDFVRVYLDDIVIHSLTWKEHLAHLQQVLERLDYKMLD